MKSEARRELGGDKSLAAARVALLPALLRREPRSSSRA
jgi:hypothetical protein